MSLSQVAKKFGFETIRNEDVLEFLIPNPVIEHVILEVRELPNNEGFRIIRHKNADLTKRFGGKKVRLEWIEQFLKFNAVKVRQSAPISRKTKTIPNKAYNDPLIKYDSIPSTYQILKKTDVKAVVKSPDGRIITVWKDGVPKLEESQYGTQTRSWERQVDGVTNWHYRKK